MALTLVALAGLAIGLGSDPVWRARLFLWRGQPMRAWDEVLRVPHSSTRDRVLADVLVKVIEDDTVEAGTRRGAGMTLSCLGRDGVASADALRRVALDPDTHDDLRAVCVSCLGWFSKSSPAATRELLVLMRAPPEARLRGVADALAMSGEGSLPLLEEALGTATPREFDQLVCAFGLRMPVETAQEHAVVARQLATLALDGEASTEHRLAALQAMRQLGTKGTAALPLLAAALDRWEPDRAQLALAFNEVLELRPKHAWSNPLGAMSRESASLLWELEVLSGLASGLGRQTVGLSESFCAPLRKEFGERFWVPPLTLLYAAVEERGRALETLQVLARRGRVMEALAASAAVLRLDPGDRSALDVVYRQRERREGWAIYVPKLLSPPGQGGAPFFADNPRHRVETLRDALQVVVLPSGPIGNSRFAPYMTVSDNLEVIHSPPQLPFAKNVVRYPREGFDGARRLALELLRREPILGGDLAAELNGQLRSLSFPSTDVELLALLAAEALHSGREWDEFPRWLKTRSGVQADDGALALLAVLPTHEGALEHLEVRLAEPKTGVLRILAALLGLLELARNEGGKLEGHGAFRLALPWVDHDNLELAMLAGAIVFSVAPDHESLESWKRRLLDEEGWRECDPFLMRLAHALAGRPEGRELARLLALELRQGGDLSWGRLELLTSAIRMLTASR